MKVEPYLFFDGRCEEAISYYRTAIGAELMMLMRNREAPQTPPPGTLPEGSEDKVLHAAFKLGDTLVMASDGYCLGKPKFEGFQLSITASDEEEAERLFAVLSEGGQVRMPLSNTFFAKRFGMLADRFGVAWMVSVPL